MALTRPGIAAVLALAGLAATCAGAPAQAQGTLKDYRLLLLSGGAVKWGAAELGTGATVTYAFVEEQLDHPGARTCAAVGPLDALLSDSALSRRSFETAVSEAFEAWTAIANIRFVRTVPEDADILIGAETEPRGRAFTHVIRQELAENAVPGLIQRSIICLNPVSGWKVGFDGNLKVYDLRYTLQHEIGHAIGLDHPGVPGVVMDFRYREQFADLQPGDVAGAVELYGPPATQTAGMPNPPVDGGGLMPIIRASAH